MMTATVAISTTDAELWSVGGALLAYLLTIVLPELVTQMRKEQTDGTRYRPSTLTWVVGIGFLLGAVGAGVLAARVLDPCSVGDAAVCGLGSIGFVAALSGTGSVVVPRP
jgi:hypothetical protein